MAVVGEAFIKITADAVDFGKDLISEVDSAVRTAGGKIASGLGSALSTAFGAVGSTIATGMKVAGTATAAFGGAVLKAGASYNILGQKSMAAFKTLLGTTEAAEDMMDSLYEFGKTSPFPRQAFIEGTQQLLGFGMEAERIIPTLDAVQNAVAATGGSATDIEEIVHVLAQVEGTGKITAQTLNQLGLRGIDAAEMIGSTLGKTGDEIRTEITNGTLDASEAVDALTEGMMDRFGGAADGVKATWEGATDRVKAAMRDMGAELLEPFIGFKEGGAGVDFVNTIADALQTLRAEIIPKLLPVFEDLADKLSGLGEFITGIFDRLGDGGFDKFADMLEGLGPVIGAVGTGLATAFSGSLPFVGQYVKGLNPVVMGLGAMILGSEELRGAFGDAFKSMAPALESLGEVVATVAGTLGDALVPILGTIADVIVKVAPSLTAFAEMLAEIAGTVGDVLVEAFEILMPPLGDFLAALVDGLVPFLPVVETLMGGLGDVLLVVAEVLGDLFEALAPAIPPITEALGMLAETLGEAIVEAVLAIAPALPPLVEALTAILLAVVPLIPPLAELITLLVEKIGAPVLVALATAVAELATGLAHVATFVAEVMGAGIEHLVGWIESLSGALEGLDFAKIGAWFKELPGLIGRAVGALGSTLSKAFASAFAALGKELPKLGRSVIGWFGDLPGLIGRALVDLGGAVLGAFIDAVVLVAQELPGAMAEVIGFFVGLPFDIAFALIDLQMVLLGAFMDAVVWLVTELPGIFAEVFSFFAGIPGKAATAIGSLGSSLVRVVSSAFSSVLETVRTGVTESVSFLAGLPGKAVSAISSLVTTLPAKMGEAMGAVLSRATQGVADIAGEIGKLPGKLLGMLGELGSAAAELGKTLINSIGDGIANVASFVGDVASSLWNALKDIINVNVIDKIANYRVRIPGPMGSTIYEGQPFGGISALRLARGGYVRARPGGQLAFIGEAGYDEVVLSTNPAYQARNRALMERAGISNDPTGAGAIFAPGSVVLHFNGATPTDDEANRIGQNVGNGIAQALAERRVDRTARAI